MDMSLIVNNIMSPIVNFVLVFIYSVLSFVFSSVVLFIFVFLCKYPVFLKKNKPAYLSDLDITFLPFDLTRWIIYDILTRKERTNIFNEFGFTLFCGRQGAGKTISMVNYLRKMKKEYPKVKIICNFKCCYADKYMDDWRDLLNINNGEDGVIFAIDEIHSEYSAASWKDFHENILSQISMQRKQRIKIIASSQAFARVVKPIREQTFSVVDCHTYFNRLTICHEYDAIDYPSDGIRPRARHKPKKLSKLWFVQSNAIRKAYDTYEKIKQMRKVEYLPRNERH